jgi:hypothetical protein
MSSLRTILGAALACSTLVAPAALAQQKTITTETMRATESMKMDAINKNAEEVVKERQKSTSDMPKAAEKPMADETDKAKAMGMEKKMDGMK